MMLDHVEQFDGENIGGALQFVARHAERGRLFLAVPPLNGGRQRLQSRKRTVAQNTKKIEVRQAWMEVTRHGGAKQKDGLDIRPARIADALNELLDFIFRNHF